MAVRDKRLNLETPHHRSNGVKAIEDTTNLGGNRPPFTDFPAATN
jgi:hypothetical protein